MVALLRGVRDYEDAYAKQQGRAEVVDVLTRYTPIKDPALYDKIVWIKLPTSGETNVEAFARTSPGSPPRAPCRRCPTWRRWSRRRSPITPSSGSARHRSRCGPRASAAPRIAGADSVELTGIAAEHAPRSARRKSMASRLKLVLGCADHDLNHPLIDGAVRSSDLDLEVVWDLADGERHRRMLRDGAFDACEFFFADYLVLRSQGAPFQGIPVFPDRNSATPTCSATGRAAIREPRDLEGKRVGIRGWANTASLWVRGILQRYYGVDLRRVTWCAPPEGFAVQVPAGISVEPLPEDADLDSLLVGRRPGRGDQPRRAAVDAARRARRCTACSRITGRPSRAFYPPDADLPDQPPRRRQDEVVRAQPWVPLSLLRLFREARDACFRRSRTSRSSPSPGPARCWPSSSP